MSPDTDHSPASLQPERRHFIGVVAALVLLVFLGFARTFYLRPLFHTPAPSTLILVHGLLMTTWIVVLLIQVALLVFRRVSWHRKLGYAGIALAAPYAALWLSTSPPWVGYWTRTLV